ncbi:hypothetical protein [Baekduia alba]|uniref:hypothetical protein n=1 Tax=Baekduia alba TaxID=2997333 RepID=UPI00234242B6|nr:hypothetical protein [Baekduia alba]
MGLVGTGGAPAVPTGADGGVPPPLGAAGRAGAAGGSVTVAQFQRATKTSLLVPRLENW